MKIDLWFPTPVYSHQATAAEAQPIEQEITKILDQEYQAILEQNDANSRSYTQSRQMDHR